MSDLLGYFITIRTYGTWLHGDPRGSVDRHHNGYGTPRLPEDITREAADAARMNHDALVLTPQQRTVVDAAVRETCAHRRWHIHVLNVRTNHVHIVVTSPEHSAERVMTDLKAWATRKLRRARLVDPERTLWEHHGSSPHLYEVDELLSAINYVENLQ